MEWDTAAAQAVLEAVGGGVFDVAYPYFALPKREFIVAGTPGHVQYTCDMVTGASTADLAVVLVDARKGIRFPVQYVIGPNQDSRGVAGTVASGSIRPGEYVIILPSGLSTRVHRVESHDGLWTRRARGRPWP